MGDSVDTIIRSKQITKFDKNRSGILAPSFQTYDWEAIADIIVKHEFKYSFTNWSDGLGLGFVLIENSVDSSDSCEMAILNDAKFELVKHLRKAKLKDIINE